MEISRRTILQKMLGLSAMLGMGEAGNALQKGKKVTAHATALPTYRCRKVNSFTPDGDLNKPVWKSVPAVSLVPATGQPQSLQPTTLRVCWSETHLYAAFHCLDVEIKATYTKRDEPLYDEDVVELFLCPTNDVRHYFEIELSPKNVLFDARVHFPGPTRENMKVDTSWDCLEIQSGVHRSEESPDTKGKGWTAEIAIPFSGLEIPVPKPGDKWRGNFYRIDYATPPEFSAWSPTLKTPANYHVPERFGHLVFVDKK